MKDERQIPPKNQSELYLLVKYKIFPNMALIITESLVEISSKMAIDV